MFDFFSFYHWDFAQAYWLILLCIPWAWFIWSKNKHQNWPNILPSLNIHYPLLNDIQAIYKNNTINGQKKNLDQRNKLKFSFAMSLLILSLAQPIAYKLMDDRQSNYNETAEKSNELKSADLILVVGTPITMSLVDYKVDNKPVDRMSFTRHSLKYFVNQYSGSQIGLVVLGNPPILWLPLTTDKLLVKNSISRLRTLLAGRLSDIGASFQLVKKEFSNAKSKVVVLISDGSLQLGKVSPQQATQELVKAGFIVYVIAIGATKLQKAKNIDKGRPGLIFDPVDLTMLKEIAKIGGGQIYHALNSQAFKDLLIQIEQKHLQAPNNKNGHKKKEEKNEHIPIILYPYPLILAMILLLSIFMKAGTKITSKWYRA